MVHTGQSVHEQSKRTPAGPWPLGFAPGDWVSERYRLEAFLGEGGMGCVFRAFDLHLNRRAALKFMKFRSSDSERHLLREARLQALVEHAAIGKVFEIGTHEGRTYITMQCVPGQTLAAYVDCLPLEAKLTLVREVAEAVHAAHGHGLIHRDLKPGNILVSEAVDGRLKPFVVDFGLARRVEEAHSTKTGNMRGTPLFMAPEQVRGDPKAIDRRTDVYGLGATLYFLLCGKPPHAGPNQAAVWVAILEREAPPLRKRMPSLPKPVEAIVAKALACEPARRYESAKAMAEDLGRFLAGDAVLASAPGALVRLGHFLRRHRWWVRTALIAATAALAVLVWGAMERRALEARSRLFNQFVQQTEEVEALHRHFSMLPRHDVTPARGYLEQKMAKVASQMAAMGGLAEAPGHYALGRAQLALRRYGEAESHLSQAHAASGDDPAIALALGQVLGALYQRELARVETLAGADQRQKARAAAVLEYREPAKAMFLLSQSRDGTLDGDPWAGAQLALFEGDGQGALALLAALSNRQPWFYEANILQGQILTRMGDRLRDDGAFEMARDRYGQARLRLEAATEVGRSDGEGYRAIASLCLAEALLAKMTAPKGLDAALTHGLAACGMALEVDPRDGEALWMTSIFKSMTAESGLQRGEDPTAALQSSLRFAEACLDREPGRPLVYNSMGMVHQLMGHHVWRQGGDPVPHFNEAIGVLQKGLSYHPNLAALHNNLGLAFLYRAQASATMDAEDPGLLSAIGHLQMAIRQLPDRVSTYLNLGAAHWLLAESAMYAGRNPEDALCQAREAFGHVLARMPDHGIAHYNQGNAVQMQGESLLAAGKPTRGAFLEALDHFQMAGQVMPEVAEVHNAIAAAFLNRAKEVRTTGGAPFEFLANASDAASRALELRPGWDLALFNWGLALGLTAQYRLSEGALDRQSLDEAMALFEEILRVNPQFADAHVAAGDLALLLARAGIGRDSAFALAANRFEEALRIQPDHAFAHFGLGRWCLQRSLSGTEPPSGRRRLLAKAKLALDRAMSIQKDQDEFAFTQGLIHLALAQLAVESGTQLDVALKSARQFVSGMHAKPSPPDWLLWLQAELGVLRIKAGLGDEANLLPEYEITIRGAWVQVPHWRAEMRSHSCLEAPAIAMMPGQ